MTYELDIGGAFREYNNTEYINGIVSESRLSVDGRRDRRRRVLKAVTAPLWGPFWLLYKALAVIGAVLSCPEGYMLACGAVLVSDLIAILVHSLFYGCDNSCGWCWFMTVLLLVSTAGLLIPLAYCHD